MTAAPEVVRLRLPDGAVMALIAKVGRRWVHAVVIDSHQGVRVLKLPIDGLRATPADYPPRRAVRRMLAAGRALGISAEARKLLKLVRSAKIAGAGSPS